MRFLFPGLFNGLVVLLFVFFPNLLFSQEKDLLIRHDVFFGGPVHKTGQPYTLSGEVVYMGADTFDSVILNWQIGEEGEVNQTHFEEIGINPYIPFVYEADEVWIPSEEGTFLLKLWFSGLNGQPEDVAASEVLNLNLEVYDHLVERDVVLLESFSSINCGSCAMITPVLRNLVAQNPERYEKIYYHPLHYENSPLYHFNPKDQDIRRDFYEIFYTPQSVVGGTYQGGSEYVSEFLFEKELQKWSGFQLEGQWFVYNDELYFNVDGDVLINLDNPERDLRLFIAAIQDSVLFDAPPGSNGEDEFFNVMRFFAPDASGIRLTPEGFQSGIAFQAKIPWIPVLETETITLIAFVQDLNSNEIYQASRMVYEVFMDPDEPDDPTNISGHEAVKLHIYPNPASGQFFISIPPGTNVQSIMIYDSKGVMAGKMQGTSYNGKVTMDAGQFSPGIYFLNIQTENQVITRKIIFR